MLWAFLLGYFVFGELPTGYVYAGAAVVIACGLFILWRERKVGVPRRRDSLTA
jgi:drug/metabolite transporter (DMT)-like permease